MTLIIGAESRNRTGTGLPPTDFKSVASTSSAISARELKARVILQQNFPHVKSFFIKTDPNPLSFRKFLLFLQNYAKNRSIQQKEFLCAEN